MTKRAIIQADYLFEEMPALEPVADVITELEDGDGGTTYLVEGSNGITFAVPEKELFVYDTDDFHRTLEAAYMAQTVEDHDFDPDYDYSNDAERYANGITNFLRQEGYTFKSLPETPRFDTLRRH